MRYAYRYPRPALTVDSVVFCLEEADLKVLLGWGGALAVSAWIASGTSHCPRGEIQRKGVPASSRRNSLFSLPWNRT